MLGQPVTKRQRSGKLVNKPSQASSINKTSPCCFRIFSASSVHLNNFNKPLSVFFFFSIVLSALFFYFPLSFPFFASLRWRSLLRQLFRVMALTKTSDTNLPTTSTAPTQQPHRREKRVPMDPLAPRRESDYNVIQPIKSIAVSKRVISTAAAPAAAPPAAAAAPHTPVRKPAEKKNKLLCDTPPKSLYDSKRNETYERSHQLGVGGFARCFLVQNKDGEYYASKTVSKASLHKEKIRTKVRKHWDPSSW